LSWSEWLTSFGYEGLPIYRTGRRLASPALAEQFPLVFNSGARTQTAFRSQHFNIPSLVSRQPLPLVYLHPSDARSRGIQDGDPVWVVSPRGRVPFWARLTEDIYPGSIEANMGGGGPLASRVAAGERERADRPGEP
jgi:anaerobic selenocysteine-containing dehydrogenase